MHMNSGVIVKQYNIMSTQLAVSRAVTSGGNRESWE